ncbi:hypothetical protein EDB19DRAFT_1678393 [Suillus lakei]|nr:hypothetical protein EDB19DRAFT_1678393 [Suillus lakei]
MLTFQINNVLFFLASLVLLYLPTRWNLEHSIFSYKLSSRTVELWPGADTSSQLNLFANNTQTTLAHFHQSKTTGGSTSKQHSRVTATPSGHTGRASSNTPHSALQHWCILSEAPSVPYVQL